MTIRQGSILNPTGKGGFADNPQNRANGRWNKETSISYQYNYLIRLTGDELNQWLKDNPENTRTKAQQIAYKAVLKAESDIFYLKEITDRTEGKPAQFVQNDNYNHEITVKPPDFNTNG